MRLVLASASPRRAELLRAAGYDFDLVRTDVDESVRDGEAAATYVRRLAAEKSAAAAALIARDLAGLKSCATTAEPRATTPEEAGPTSCATTAEPRAATPEEARPTSCATTAESRAATPEEARPTSRAATAESRATTPEEARVKCCAATAGSCAPAQDAVILGADTVVVVDEQILGKPRDDGDAERMLRLLSGRAHVVLTGVSLRRGAYELGRVVTTRVQFAALSSGDISWYLATGEGCDKAGAYAIQGLASRFVTSIDGSYSNVVGLPVAVVHELLTDIASGSMSGYSEKQISPRKSL